MRSEKGKRKKAGIYFFSISVHTILICLLAFPFLKSEQNREDIYQGLLVEFDARQSTSAQKLTKKKTSTNPQKEAAETKILKPKLEKSREKDNSIESVKKTSKKKTNEDSQSLDNRQTLTEKRRDYLVKNFQQAELRKKKALEAEKRKAKLEEKANKAKYEKMKDAFSHLLKNANHETTTDYTDFELSDESMAISDEYAETGATQDISNRQVLFIPEIIDHSQKEGRVVINICVNAKGKVVSAKYTQRGSTTTDGYLINLATKNAWLYRFSESQAEKQCGKVNIDFEVR